MHAEYHRLARYIRNSLARQTDELQRIESILLKKKAKKLHFNSSNKKVSYIFEVKDDEKFILSLHVNQFQTMEDKRTWDCVKKPFQAIVT